MTRTSSLSERPGSDGPRRLSDWLKPTDSKKVHSLVDKVYQRKNLELAWRRVRENRGAGGIDGQSVTEFEELLDEQLDRLHEELKSDGYRPVPVRQRLIPKPGQPGKFRALGIPTIYDRVCQQALLNRLEPIFEPVFDDASFGYRRGRSAKDALRKIWRELQEGREWIVDADLKDFFGSVDHDKLVTLVAQRVSDGRVLRLIRSMLKAGCMVEGRRLATEQGTPQGGVVSPALSNVLLTPFDREMRRRGFELTRYADDWVVSCRSRAQARRVLAQATKILKELGVTLNQEKTRIVHVRHGFEFLGYKIKRGSRPMRLAAQQIRGGTRAGSLYAYPREKSMRALSGSDPATHAAKGSGEYTGADRADQSGHSRLGLVLPQGSGPHALPPSGPLDRAAPLVASLQTLAMLWLEEPAGAQALWRARFGQSRLTDSFFAVSSIDAPL